MDNRTSLGISHDRLDLMNMCRQISDYLVLMFGSSEDDQVIEYQTSWSSYFPSEALVTPQAISLCCVLEWLKTFFHV